jgi:hypothetical protein
MKDDKGNKIEAPVSGNQMKRVKGSELRGRKTRVRDIK